MLRIAAPEDFDLVYKLSSKFIEQTVYKSFYNPASLSSVVEEILQAPKELAIVILNDEVGMIAGKVVPFSFGIGLMATEVGWWVEPEHRKTGVGVQLLNAFEEWAKRVGCAFSVMVSLDDEVEKYYKKQGYTLSERVFMKELN